MVKHRSGQTANDLHKALPNFMTKRIIEGAFIFIFTLALYILLSLSTFQAKDPKFLTTHSLQLVTSAGGAVGIYLSFGLIYLFGYLSYLLPGCLAYMAWMILKDHHALKNFEKSSLFLRGFGLFFLLIGLCGLFSFGVTAIGPVASYSSGGMVGKIISQGLNNAFNLQGSILLLFALSLAGMTWFTGISWIRFIEYLGRYTLIGFQQGGRQVLKGIYWLLGYISKQDINPIQIKESPLITKKNEPRKPRSPSLVPPTIDQSSLPSPIIVSATEVKKQPIKPVLRGGIPSLELLDKGKPGKPMGGYTHTELETLSRDVEQHLLDFGIQADVVAVHPGPVITRFELQLAAGVKVSKLTALAKDLARSLSVISVRVVEIIPGKTVVGIELPNQDRAMVRLSEVLGAEVYQQAHSALTLALGVDIAGHPMVVDLAKMPHLLVAGTTGSGKSVGINAMILSLLFKATPEQVRLIMVDPKMLELSVYDGIPHLLTPVVTDMKEAASALRWCVAEMERRYRLMAALGVRNLSGYNTKISEAKAQGEPITDPLWKSTDSMDQTAPELEQLPYIVVIIDELADMMMVVGKKVEQLIARIAQKARAAGIHLILATQRPSVDVLTGLIKSNIPTRISFQVSSKIDSRTILDQQGAEQLLGHGDMLFLAPGTGTPLRVHGAFVDDKEVHRIAADWRSRGQPDYIEEITQLQQDGSESGFTEESGSTEESDPLYDQAVEFVMQTRKASISGVQRRFKIGYNRAARLVEEMERTGIVGPLEGGFREVLVTSTVDS